MTEQDFKKALIDLSGERSVKATTTVRNDATRNTLGEWIRQTTFTVVLEWGDKQQPAFRVDSGEQFTLEEAMDRALVMFKADNNPPPQSATSHVKLPPQPPVQEQRWTHGRRCQCEGCVCNRTDARALGVEL